MPRFTSLLVVGALACARPGDDGDASETECSDVSCETDPTDDSDAAPIPDTDDATDDTDDPGPTDTDIESVPLTAEACFAQAFVNPPSAGPDYDQYAPVVGSHCLGTNHQDITGVERVVFLGDSVTVGTPPTPTAQYYRNRLARRLATQFGLQGEDDVFWQGFDPFSGETWSRESGDFASCARFGARTDDLMQDDDQVVACLPEDKRHLRTLVVMTMGGNDLASFTEDGLAGEAPEAIWPKVEGFVALLEETITWIKEPGRFPNGVFVVFANLHEFTDGTGDTSACITAPFAGFGGSWDDPAALEEMVIWVNEQYARIAVETGTDMIFMLEEFCGHGWRADDPTAPCYRGPGTPRWMDITCIHPTPEGHKALADMFDAVIDE